MVINTGTHLTSHFDAVVAGSGIAGLFTALRIADHGRVALITKGAIEDSNTRYAQGGIAAAVFEDDTSDAHIADTLAAGAELCDLEAVRILCTAGPECIRELLKLGVAFDRDATHNLARGLEAAHSNSRILHAGGDATGWHIEIALVAAVRNHPNITVYEKAFLTDLLVENGEVKGVQLIDGSTLQAAHVVLATGGIGQLFLHTTNPAVATGDGLAAAYRAGAIVADAEFVQFHPTATILPAGNAFLISEAVRGEGAVLRNIAGERFVDELLPRDVVARAIATQMAEQDGQPVFLDATDLSEEFLAKRFPTIDATCRKVGIDWTQVPIPVTPAAHYFMGGIWTDHHGRSSLPGLYACGEVASTGVHGANRLASNSLLEGAVFGGQVADVIVGKLNLSPPEPPEAYELLAMKSIETTTPTLRDLQDLMWNNVGLLRDIDGLRIANKQLSNWEVNPWKQEQYELLNLLTIAKLITHSALERSESRGAHFRSDYPHSSPKWQHRLFVRTS